MPHSTPSAPPPAATKGKAFKIGAVATLLIAAFFTGRITSPTVHQPEDQNASHAKRNHRDSESRNSRQRTFEDQNAKTHRLSTSMANALAEPDANERYGTSWAIIDKISHKNWKEILDSFQETGREKGFIDHGMYREALKRVGQVCGREAIDYYTEKGEAIHGSIIYGWGMSEPESALAWAKEFSTGQLRLDHIRSAVSGAARLQHEKGTQLMAALPEKEWTYCCGIFLWNTVHGPGVDSAEIWAINQTDETRRAAAINTAHHWVNKSAILGRSPEKLAAWINATDDGTPEASSRTYSLIGETLKSHPENGAQLIQSLSDANYTDSNTLVGNISGYFSADNLQTLTDWAKNTSNSELGDAMLRHLNEWQNRQAAKSQ